MLNLFVRKSFVLPSLYAVVLLSVIGCSSQDYYKNAIPDVRKAAAQQQYANAITLMNRNKDYSRPCNKLLYNMEMGKLYHSAGDYVKSNTFLEEADRYFDDWYNLRVMDIQGNYKLGDDHWESGHMTRFKFLGLANTDYLPEDYEKIMIHYYKALNYLCLKKTDEALVEARSLELLLHNLSAEDYLSDHSKILSDPFTQILIGLIYESGNDMNAAFVAYRNAGKLYKNEKDMPEFLKHHILQTAYLTGLGYETVYYENLFGMSADSIAAVYARSMVILWENGMTPLREAQSVIVSSSGYKNIAPPFTMIVEESRGSFLLDLLFRYRKVEKPIPGKLIVIPNYVSSPSYYQSCKITTGGDSNSFNGKPWVIEDIESLTTQYINERSMIEVSQYGSGAPDTAQVSYGVMPDLRNWHSLPAKISYCRVPLQQSDSSVSLILLNSKNEADTMRIAADPDRRFMVKNAITYK